MVSVVFTSIFAFTGLCIIILFACRNGVFAKWCSSTNNGTSQPYGIGVATDEGMDSSKVTARRAEPEEEGAYGDPEEESGRSGGLSEDERSEKDEDWRGTV